LPKKGKFIDPIALAAKYGDTPRYGGKFLNAVIENIPHHDYSQGVGSNWQVQTQILNTLLMSNPYDWTQIMPDLAHSWEISPDGRKYTFYLHEGVKWHDGTPFSSADVKYTFDRIIAKGKILGNETPGTFNNGMWVAIIDSIETPDASTLVINTKGSTPTLLAILSDAYSSIIPKHISEKDPLNALKEQLKSIGTGPYFVTEEPTTLLWKYERNPNYFKDGLPFVDAMESHVILEIEVRATAVVTERVHWSDPTPLPQLPYELANRLGQEPGVIHEGISSLAFNHFIVNATKAPFDDIRVRQAFSEALDRPQFLIDGLGNQRGVIGTGLFPNGQWAMPIDMRNELIGYGPDMEKRSANAKRLLAEYEAEKGPIDWDNDVHYQCATNHISCENAQIAQALIKKNLGVDLTLDTMEIMRLVGLFVDGGYNQSGIIGIIEFDDPTSAFGKAFISTSRYGGWTRHVNPEFDALFQKQLFIADVDERKKIVWEMDAMAMNDAAFNILLWTITEHLRRDYIKGWVSFPSSQGTSVRMEHIWLDIPGTRTSQ
jgi:peptide/nickel transport system substrate-binding protein